MRRRVCARTVSVRDRWRSEIILLSAEGLTQQQIAERMDLSCLSVNRWVGRFAMDRLAGLTDAITEKSFASTRELANAIITFLADLADHNDNPRHYVWKAKGEI